VGRSNELTSNRRPTSRLFRLKTRPGRANRHYEYGSVDMHSAGSDVTHGSLSEAEE
jgi:hypothetical protein